MKVTSNKETTTTVKIVLDSKHSSFFKKFMYDLSEELKNKTPVK